VGAAPPAWAADAPLVALHLISLLGDDVASGWAARVRTAEVVESETWKRYALQAISLWGADFCPLACCPSTSFEMTAVVSNCGDSENRGTLISFRK
jgi:hypothetical protein